MFPKPEWIPVIVEDINIIAERLRSYTGGSRAFVVYEYGTTVFSDTSLARNDEDYNTTLDFVTQQAPDFKVIPMNDGNFLVRFARTVSGLVLRDFYLEHVDGIRSSVEKKGLLPGERLLTTSGDTINIEHYHAGVYARAKLYQDVAERNIKIRFIP